MGVLIALVAAVPSGALLTLVAMIAHGTRFARPGRVVGALVLYATGAGLWIASGSDWCT